MDEPTFARIKRQEGFRDYPQQLPSAIGSAITCHTVSHPLRGLGAGRLLTEWTFVKFLGDGYSSEGIWSVFALFRGTTQNFLLGPLDAKDETHLEEGPR